MTNKTHKPAQVTLEHHARSHVSLLHNPREKIFKKHLGPNNPIPSNSRTCVFIGFCFLPRPLSPATPAYSSSTRFFSFLPSQADSAKLSANKIIRKTHLPSKRAIFTVHFPLLFFPYRISLFPAPSLLLYLYFSPCAAVYSLLWPLFSLVRFQPGGRVLEYVLVSVSVPFPFGICD